MSRDEIDRENPDRLYTITGGRSRVDADAFDLVTLVVAECDPTPAMQSEHARILRFCRSPRAVVEVSAHLRLPVSVTRILLCDLLDAGRIMVRQPARSAPRRSQPGNPYAHPDLLKEVLVGLRRL
ncbi:DUF742 domain-containing protein [Frankia sp. CNm7]|uniref:DUF742 domain-containing protein n=1 Tax=Frankia nepalensis TaxID=1836974 RepID=A0A937RN28_9ACTN|nr:DUF742 domain-containing protein [Frankia nepalensis]MBL7500059.1 DUF742 domain-containing protein [Frankia nepalensis]MBL7509407.1 DUF742 domain-containing protein [Frankia nepalensis]MBL7519351.1 DUF742 domain-containing protein [Frankia nepalensis]MBL7631900.1 DUF742 domain-containing protein [Frankia nepalensis]